MSKPGTFIVSFDCEGKWGMADHLTPTLEALLTNAAIYRAYADILAAFKRNGLRGTFAFVGAFTMTPGDFAEFHEKLRDAPVDGRPWLAAFRRDAARGMMDGWLAPEALQRVRAEGGHEVATHGFTHLPLNEATVDPGLFRHEMGLACELADRQGWTPRTIIYPRNQIGHTSLLAEFGIIGYREKLWPNLRGTARQFRSLLTEFGLGAKSQGSAAPVRPIAIPSGHILNFWHNRSRRLVPREVTRRRWRAMMLHAAQTGGLVHLWSHPHNFLSDPELITTFDLVLQDAAGLVRAGRLINVTQEEYSLNF